MCGLGAATTSTSPPAGCAIPRETTKTDAGERVIPMLPSLRERLIEPPRSTAVGAGEPAFPTRNGTASTPNNVRSTVLGRVHARANELLAADGRPPIAH